MYLVTRTLISLLLATEGGARAVIGISSMTSHFASYYISMGMGKLVMKRFIEFFDNEYKDQGLVAYALHPGGVPTRNDVTDYRYCTETRGCSLEGSRTALTLPSYISHTSYMAQMSHRSSPSLYIYVYISPDFHRFTIKSFTQFSHTAKLTNEHVPRKCRLSCKLV